MNTKNNPYTKNSTLKDSKFLEDYWLRYKKILFDSRDDKGLIDLRNKILLTQKKGGKLIFVGNGASASLASHAATDFTKQAKIKAISFNDHNLITALSNDFGYDMWVVKALEFYANPFDKVIFISVSGNSKNLVNGLKFAKKISLSNASFTGSSSNNFLKINSDCSLWVDSKAYNIVESIHTIWITLVIDLLIGNPEYFVS